MNRIADFPELFRGTSLEIQHFKGVVNQSPRKGRPSLWVKVSGTLPRQRSLSCDYAGCEFLEDHGVLEK